MNLINKKVTHKRFGTGIIVKQNASNIEIHFESENKMFVYPDVFGKHLKLHDKSDAKSLEEIIQKKENELKEEEWKKENLSVAVLVITKKGEVGNMAVCAVDGGKMDYKYVK